MLVDGTHNADVITPMHNLIEYSDNYSKISRMLWRCYGD